MRNDACLRSVWFLHFQTKEIRIKSIRGYANDAQHSKSASVIKAHHLILVAFRSQRALMKIDATEAGICFGLREVVF